MSWFDGLRHRVRSLVLGERYSAEQSDEIREHLALEASQHAHEGATSDDASAAARRRFGNMTVTRENLRAASGFSFADRISQDLRYAARGLRRTPVFTITVALTFALGVGANAAVFSFLDRVFVRAPTGVDDPEGIRRLYARFARPTGQMTIPLFNYPSYEAIRDGAGARTLVAAYRGPDSLGIRIGERDVAGRASWVSAGYFTALGVSNSRGRFFAPDELAIESAAGVAIVSHAFWVRALGSSENAIGQSIALARRQFTIIGVTEPGFVGMDLDAADVFLPLGAAPGDTIVGQPWFRRGGFILTIVARVASGESEQRMLAAVSASYNRQPEVFGWRRDTATSILAGPILEARGPGDTDPVIAIGARIGGVAAIVLLIACANLATLLLVRTAQRRREIAMRLALGVSRSRLAWQFITENLLLAAIGGALAVAVAAWGGAALRGLLAPGIQWDGGPVDLRVLAFIASAAIGVALLAGLAPVLQARSVELSDALKSGAREAAHLRSRARTALLIGQSALALVLLAGAGLFVRSLGNVRAIPIGYASDSILYSRVTIAPGAPDQGTLPRGIEELTAELAAAPGVIATAHSTGEPMRGWRGLGFALPGGDSVRRLGPARIRMNFVSAGFFSAVGMPLVAGRGFNETDGAEAVIVNETMARTFWPGKDPLGQCVIFSDGCSYVIGVSRNAAERDVIEPPAPQFFKTRGAPASLIVRVAPRQAAAVAQQVRQALQAKFPNAETVEVIRMRDDIDVQLRPWRLGTSLFTAFGLLAVVVAAIGVYSVVAYTVAQRSREVGVRIALGATTSQVVRMVLAQGTWVVLAGAVLGIGGALAAGKLVATQLYGVTPRDPAVLAGAALILVAVGVLASAIPALRAARVDPVTTLRAE